MRPAVLKIPADLGQQFSRSVQRPEWLRAFAVAAAALLVVYLAGALFAGARTGNAWGVTYGALAAVLMLAVAALGARRRTMSMGFGRAQDWAQFHVYAGALFLLLVLMHTGFRWPRAALTWWLFALSLWVTLTGLAGVGLRKWLPRVLASGLTTEVLYERIPELAAELRQRAAALAAGCSAPVRDFHQKRLAADLAAPRVRWIYFVDITGGIQARLRELEFLRGLLDGEDRRRLDELETLYRTKLELDAHLTLQRPLRWWLYAHVPASLVLILLVAVHVVTVLMY